MWATMAVMLFLIATIAVFLVVVVLNRWQIEKWLNNDLKWPVIGVMMLVLGMVVVQFVALAAQGQGNEAKSSNEQQWFDLHGVNSFSESGGRLS